MVRLNVGEIDSKIRLDQFITNNIESLNRNTVSKFFDQNKVLVNKTTKKPSYSVKQGDRIEIDFDPVQSGVIPQIELPIIFEDDDCIVIDKPSGVLTHSKGAFNPEATVATFISNKITKQNGERAGIVHRLDRATSGVIICAKTPESYDWLSKQFADRKSQKTYIAVIEGTMSPDEGLIDAPIGRNPKKPQSFRVHPSGKPAQTQYKTLKSNDNYSMLELKPKTGRTHQLRVHLKYLNHPIVGDMFYEGKQFERLLLHSLSLTIQTSSHSKPMTFTAPLPKIFDTVIK